MQHNSSYRLRGMVVNDWQKVGLNKGPCQELTSSFLLNHVLLLLNYQSEKARSNQNENIFCKCHRVISVHFAWVQNCHFFHHIPFGCCLLDQCKIRDRLVGLNEASTSPNWRSWANKHKYCRFRPKRECFHIIYRNWPSVFISIGKGSSSFPIKWTTLAWNFYLHQFTHFAFYYSHIPDVIGKGWNTHQTLTFFYLT